jgi:tRNA(Ile)-lysidine synthase
MGSSRKPDADDLPRTVASFFRSHLSPPSRVCVGLSGGRDSVVLLHLLAQCRSELEIALSAVHVNHQLSPNADRWAAFCSGLCGELAVPLRIERVSVARDSGKGIEATARKARYEIYDKVDADVIALAHHRDDQAETVLLQALRGAGLKGISGMPVVKATKQNSEKLIVRPLLDVASTAIAAYAAQHKLEWIDDESNDDIRYFRNYLRHEVLPRIAVHAPHYRDSLTRLGQHAAEAQQLLDELGEIDSRSAIDQQHLRLELLLTLSDPRAKNLLRYFFSLNEMPVPNTVQLEEVLHQLRSRQADDRTEIAWADRVLRCHRGRIYIDVKVKREAGAWCLPWRGETEIALPLGCGRLRLEPSTGEGIERSQLLSDAVTIRSRVGGERFRSAASRPRRTLKNLLQEAGIPPWQRDRMPLIFSGDTLVWVPEIGIAAGFGAERNQDGISISWQT